METRMLGRTGIPVSRIGLGMAALGRPGYINLGHAGDLGRSYSPGQMEAHSHTVLDAAWAAGITYFDAARSYGRGEAFLSSWLHRRQLASGQAAASSKWGYTYTAGWQVEAPVHEVKDHSLEVLRRQWAESSSLLRPWLRLYQIHSATLESGVLDRAEVLDALAQLKSEGIAIGLSLSGPGQAATLRRAVELHVGGQPLFDAVQATWNLLEPSAGPALAEAHAAGMGVAVKEALANGRLTSRNADPAYAARLARLRAESQALGASPHALALAAVLAQPWADAVLSGAATADQLHSNLAALNLRLDAEVLSRLQSLAEPPQAYWDYRKAMPWN
jgi:aryl-alcohol dehydrogenase-like predicted oxidoreductase